jgi:hypothetical protein
MRDPRDTDYMAILAKRIGLESLPFSEAREHMDSTTTMFLIINGRVYDFTKILNLIFDRLDKLDGKLPQRTKHRNLPKRTRTPHRKT